MEKRCALLEAENGYRRMENKSLAGEVVALRAIIANGGRLPYDHGQKWAERHEEARAEREAIGARLHEEFGG